jgi:peroxiredoxin/outer membrane lipoprotein-sorting protein
MKKKIIIWMTIFVAGLLVEGVSLYILISKEPFKGPFRDEPKARALYEKMIETMRQAESLSYTVKCSGPTSLSASYTVWMKKPNYFRVETVNQRNEKCGTIVGDGEHLWIFWPGECPLLTLEEKENYEQSQYNFYMKMVLPPGMHSLGHAIMDCGAGLGMATIDPSTFHGYTDSFQPYLDGARFMGTDKVDDKEYDVIEVSFMKRQRNWYLWLSREDHLPRKLTEIVRVRKDLVQHEKWLDVTVNAKIPSEKFVWTPPDGWRQWKKPALDSTLLALKQAAPDFELPLVGGDKVKLSDYKGKIVWLYIWRVGCPVCREEMCHIQELYEKYKGRDVVILGLNCADDRKIALDFLQDNSATFPNILDSSRTAMKVAHDDYKASGGSVPLNYIIDREGKVVDAWYGYEEGHKRAIAALEKAGMKLDKP